MHRISRSFCETFVLIKRNDHVLYKPLSSIEVPWAKVSGFYEFKYEKRVLNLALISICEPVQATKLVDPLTYAPHLRLTKTRRFILAESIQQRVFTFRDSRSLLEPCFWVVWFLTWGPLKYPEKHREHMLAVHKPSY